MHKSLFLEEITMEKRIVLKRLTDNSYLSVADECSKSMLPDCKYTFRAYNPYKVVRFNTEEESLAAYADYRKHNCVEDVQIINIICA